MRIISIGENCNLIDAVLERDMAHSFTFISLFLQCYILFKRKVELRIFIEYYFVFLDVLQLGKFAQAELNTNYAREKPHTPNVQRST